MKLTRHYRSNVLISLAILILVIFLVPFIHHLASPAVGSVHTGTPKASNNSGQFAYTAAKISHYGDLQIVNDFAVLPTEEVRLPYVARASYARSNSPTWQLNLAVSQLPTGNLRDDGTYNYRFTKRDLYAETVRQVDGETIHIMRLIAPGKFEQTAYLTHDGLLVTITLSVSSDLDSASIQQAYDYMVDSWRWQ